MNIIKKVKFRSLSTSTSYKEYIQNLTFTAEDIITVKP